jgi:cyanophycinase
MNMLIISNYIAKAIFLMAISTSTHACMSEESEPDDTSATPNIDLCSGTTVTGILDNNDVDWFTFDVAEAGIISISLEHSGKDNFNWSLHESNGSLLLNASSKQIPETAEQQLTGPGSYLLKLSSVKGTGWYDLDVNFSPDGSDSTCSYGNRPKTPGGLKQWISGNTNDSCVSLSAGSGATLLMGGGAEVDEAFTDRVTPHVGQGIDVVVLRTTGTNAYNDYLLDLLNADSVETIIVDKRSKADEDYVDWAIRSAEFVWVAGGDQTDYLNQWEGMKVQSSLQSVFDKGGVIGGTSAGMAIMSASIYDPDGVGTAVSLGHHNNNHFSIAASERSAIFITNDGQSIVDGTGEIYIFRETPQTTRTQLACGQPLIYTSISRTKLLSGDSYNFITQSNNGIEIIVDVDGRNTNFYNPTNPY